MHIVFAVLQFFTGARCVVRRCSAFASVLISFVEGFAYGEPILDDLASLSSSA